MTVLAVRRWAGEPTNTAPEEHDAVAWFGSAELDALDDSELAHPRIRDAARLALAPVVRSVQAPSGLPWSWGALPEDLRCAFPCDAWVTGASIALTHAIRVDAPSSQVFPWLAQLRTAPGSYVWIANIARRSPRTLPAHQAALEVGQAFLSGQVVSFATGEHITMRATGAAQRLFGVHCRTYRVSPEEPNRCRIVARLNVEAGRNPWRVVRRMLLAWAHLIMVRRQLRALRALAERHTD
jgi:hypothetical protein